MRFRLAPMGSQEEGLLVQCAHARFVWNLGLEQRLMWRPGRPATPGYVGQAAQLTQARRAEPWLASGSQTVQQQALRDLDQAWRNYFAGTHGRPSWRKAGTHEGFRIVGDQARRVEKLSRKRARVLVPKVGWVKFRRTRAIPEAASYRITRDRAGLRAREADRRRDWAEKLTTQLARDYDVIRLEDPDIKAMARSARGSVEEPGRNVRQKARLNRGILGSGWGLLVRRLEAKAPGRVEKVPPGYTSQTCAACGHCAAENRESQAVFRCVACGHTAHADTNAAINIAARRAVTARGDLDTSRSTKREPQLSLLPV